jgi:hypothetical protein
MTPVARCQCEISQTCEKCHGDGHTLESIEARVAALEQELAKALTS